MDSAAYNKLHKPIRASDRCDLGLRILFRSGRGGLRFHSFWDSMSQGFWDTE